MIESPFSFLNSESLWPEDTEVGEAGTGSEFSMDLGSRSGESVISESLFGSLLDDEGIDFVNELDSESDDMTDYLKGKRKPYRPDKNKSSQSQGQANQRAGMNQFGENFQKDHVVDNADNEESNFGDIEIIDVGNDNVITLFAKDLPEVKSCTTQIDQTNQNKTIKNRPVRSRQPLMSSAPIFVLKHVEPKRPIARAHSSRSTSDDENFSMESKGSKCMSKNAILARELREKKKKYVQELESTVEVLKSRNSDLETKYSKQSKHVKSLENEVQYLRNVLANQTTIASLLNSVHKTPGISFTSSIGISGKRKCVEDSESQQSSSRGVYVQTRKKMKECDDELDYQEKSVSATDNNNSSVKTTTYKSLIAIEANSIARNC